MRALDHRTLGLWRPLLLLLVPMLAACAARWERKAEAVFREHNAVIGELMLRWEDAEDERQRERLEQAEADLVTACAPLNRAAARQRDGRRVEGRLAIAASIDRCACRTEAVRSLLAGQPVTRCPDQ